MTVTSHDPDNDPVNYAYQWQKDTGTGFQPIAGETSSTLDLSTAGNGNRGDRIRVVVTPNDGFVEGAPVTTSRRDDREHRSGGHRLTRRPDPLDERDPHRDGDRLGRRCRRRDLHLRVEGQRHDREDHPGIQQPHRHPGPLPGRQR